MRTGILAFVCATLVLATSNVAQADVDGQRFQIQVTSSVSGSFDGVLSFFADGSFTFVASGDGGFGSYTQTGTSTTTVNATIEDGDQYFGTFRATAEDPKQQPGLRGLLARFRNTPATITGQGFGNAGDVFRFSGTEILP
jgi:hypothetical protein